jgi:hypothetical protein
MHWAAVVSVTHAEEEDHTAIRRVIALKRDEDRFLCPKREDDEVLLGHSDDRGSDRAPRQ